MGDKEREKVTEVAKCATTIQAMYNVRSVIEYAVSLMGEVLNMNEENDGLCKIYDDLTGEYLKIDRMCNELERSPIAEKIKRAAQ